jgi:hypothetical protein
MPCWVSIVECCENLLPGEEGYGKGLGIGVLLFDRKEILLSIDNGLVIQERRGWHTELDGSTPGTAQRPIRACNTKTSTTRNSTNMGSIEAALAAIESLNPGEKLVYAQIAREYDVEPTTLARRHKGASISSSLDAQNRQALHPQQEQELLRYIERLTKRGLPPTRAMIRNFASQIAQRELGVHWVDRLIQRYPEQLISKWTTAMDKSRHKADSESKYSLYFNLLREKIDQYHVEARHVYNMCQI